MYLVHKGNENQISLKNSFPNKKLQLPFLDKIVKSQLNFIPIYNNVP